MQSPNLSIIIAVIAVSISVWTRVETFVVNRRQQRVDRAKRVGEALIAAQKLKNELSNCISALKGITVTDTVAYNRLQSEFTTWLAKLETEYTQVWDYTKAFEEVIGAFERREDIALDDASIEAKIAHFNQRCVVAEYDISYITIEMSQDILALRQSR